MPIIRFHAVNKESILNAGKELQQALADKFQTGLDNITFEVIDSTFISCGEVDEIPYPMVEILSFARTKEVEHSVAKEISERLASMGYPACDVFYNYILKSGYYVDGEPL